MPMSPADRDMMIRTIIGEAENQPEDGQAAVAHVILNRTNAGKWGKNVTETVLQPKQFEPWSTRARELLAIDPNSPRYRKAAAIVDGVDTGAIPDPTDGATHFLEPNIVKRRRGGTLPDWASGPQKQIGDHVFYYGGGKPTSASAMAFNEADGISDADLNETAKIFGIKTPGVKAATSAAPVATPAAIDPDVAETAKMFGIDLAPKKPAPKVEPVAAPAAAPVITNLAAKPAYDAGFNLQNQVVEGMPIIGPLMNKAVAATGAGIQGLVNDGPSTFGERYGRNLQAINQENKAFSKENPASSTAANLTGGLMSMGPLAATRIGGAALGSFGPSLGSKIMTGTVGGSGIGLVDAALRNEDPIEGAKIGAIGGAAGPVLGELVRKGVSWVGNNMFRPKGALQNLDQNTVSKLVNAYEGETPASVAVAQSKAGPAGFLGDMNPAFTDIAGGIADTPGPGKAIVRGAYQQRADNQMQRVEKALTDAAGPKTDIEQFKNFTVEARKAAADPLYEQWRTTAIHPTDKLKELMPRLEASGAFNMAEELAGISGHPMNRTFFTGGPQKAFPTAESWDYVKRGLDRSIDKAYGQNDKTLARELIKLKGEMIGEIEKTPGGKIWKQARSEFADRSAILDQVEAGRDTFLGGRGGLSVDELREELKHLKGPELAARVVGMRSAAAEAMGATTRGDTTLRNKILAPNNREKMELLLGKKKADELVKSMEQEAFIGDKYQNVVGGSQTTPKLKRAEALQAAPMPQWDFDFAKPGTYLPPSWREQFTPHGIVNAWRGQAAGNAVNQLAPLMVTPMSHPSMPALIRSLQAEATRRGAVANAGATAGNVISGLVTGPGTSTARRTYARD